MPNHPGERYEVYPASDNQWKNQEDERKISNKKGT